MPKPRPHTLELASWAAALRYEDIPSRVVSLAKSQAASVFASAHAGYLTKYGRQVVAAVRRHAPAGASPILADGSQVGLDAALQANCALGMAQDYDDYLFMGHTGHSAVWVAFLAGLEAGATGEQVIAAQVAANEVAGRLGAACILGPQNGQLWTHIHLAGTVIAAGRIFGLSAHQMVNALGIAYAQPVYGLFPGFMGPGSKLLSAATPIQIGLQAVRYAQAGLTGCPTIIEDRQGFLRHFAYRPIPNMLTGLGKAWVTDTLAVKPYPGCAYIDTTIDGVLALRERVAAERGEFKAADVAGVDVEASLLTMEMDRLSHLHLDERELTPVNINFNIPINVAIALMCGELGAEQLSDGFLQQNREEIVEISHRVSLRHDWSATLDLLNGLDQTVGASRFFAGMTLRDLRYVGMRSRRDGHADLAGAARGQWGGLVRAAFGPTGGFLRRVLNLGKRGSSKIDLDEVDFSRVQLPFQAKVTLRLSDGSAFTAIHKLPRGAAANGDLHEVSRSKLVREIGRGGSPEQGERAWLALQEIEVCGVGDALAKATAGESATHPQAS